MSLKNTLLCKIFLKFSLHCKISLKNTLHCKIFLRFTLHCKMSLKNTLHCKIFLKFTLHCKMTLMFICYFYAALQLSSKISIASILKTGSLRLLVPLTTLKLRASVGGSVKNTGTFIPMICLNRNHSSIPLNGELISLQRVTPLQSFGKNTETLAGIRLRLVISTSVFN